MDKEHSSQTKRPHVEMTAPAAQKNRLPLILPVPASTLLGVTKMPDPMVRLRIRQTTENHPSFCRGVGELSYLWSAGSRSVSASTISRSLSVSGMTVSFAKGSLRVPKDCPAEHSGTEGLQESHLGIGGYRKERGVKKKIEVTMRAG
jgi:hypothetical protein